MLVVDSSVFIASLSPSDSTHDISRQFLSKLAVQDVILPTLILAEVATVLHRNKYKEIPTVIRNISTFPLVHLDHDFIEQMMGKLPEMPVLKTADMIIVICAKAAKATLVTWDKQLLKLQKKVCEVITPDGFLRDQRN